MLTAVGTVNGLPKTGHLTRVPSQLFLRLIEFFFQWFNDVLDQYSGGVLSVVQTHGLSVGLRPHRFRFRFPDGGTQRPYCRHRTHKAATEYHVHYFAEFHTRFLFLLSYCLMPISASHFCTSKLGQAFAASSL